MQSRRELLGGRELFCGRRIEMEAHVGVHAGIILWRNQQWAAPEGALLA